MYMSVNINLLKFDPKHISTMDRVTEAEFIGSGPGSNF